MLRYCLTVLPGRPEAEEVAGLAMADAWRALRAGPLPSAPVRVWLLGVAHDRCADTVRARPATGDESLAALPLRRRGARALHEVNGLSRRQVAAALRITPEEARGLLAGPGRGPAARPGRRRRRAAQPWPGGVTAGSVGAIATASTVAAGALATLVISVNGVGPFGVAPGASADAPPPLFVMPVAAHGGAVGAASPAVSTAAVLLGGTRAAVAGSPVAFSVPSVFAAEHPGEPPAGPDRPPPAGDAAGADGGDGPDVAKVAPARSPDPSPAAPVTGPDPGAVLGAPVASIALPAPDAARRPAESTAPTRPVRPSSPPPPPEPEPEPQPEPESPAPDPSPEPDPAPGETAPEDPIPAEPPSAEPPVEEPPVEEPPAEEPPAEDPPVEEPPAEEPPVEDPPVEDPPAGPELVAAGTAVRMSLAPPPPSFAVPPAAVEGASSPDPAQPPGGHHRRHRPPAPKPAEPKPAPEPKPQPPEPKPEPPAPEPPAPEPEPEPPVPAPEPPPPDPEPGPQEPPAPGPGEEEPTPAPLPGDGEDVPAEPAEPAGPVEADAPVKPLSP